MNLHQFSVTIFYREPSYARTTGSDEKLYRGSFEVQARDQEDAVGQALAQYKKIERLSGVGWVRRVVRVDCRLVDAPGSA
ncbi:MAG: hypothetical protein ABI333_04825 [bacterium]